MKRILFLTLILLLSACSAQVLPTIAPTVAPTMTEAAPTSTPPQPTATATLQPTMTTTPTSTGVFSWNNLGTQESGGLKIEIARIVIGEKSALTDTGYEKLAAFDVTPVLVEIIFKVTNTTGREIKVYPTFGTVIAGGEQVELLKFGLSGAQVGENVSGKIYPGVTVIGGVWFGLKRTSLQDLQKLTVVISPPVDAATLAELGPEYRFELDLSSRDNQPLPDELK